MQALKEWAIVCAALEEGRQTILLRKGGILEYRKGFEVKHEKFLLFPTFEHQARESIKPEYADRLEQIQRAKPQDTTAIVSSFAEVKYVNEISDRALLARLGRYHIWSDQYVNTRMDYNPSKPMSVMILRVFRLAKPLHIDVRPEWAGCKSWIPLDSIESEALLPQRAEPALDEPQFSEAQQRIMGVLQN